jgi:hypothetical protein
MLPLVPLPALAITSADIAFTMEVKTSEVNKDSSDTSGILVLPLNLANI